MPTPAPLRWAALCETGAVDDTAAVFDDGTVLRHADLRAASDARATSRGAAPKRLVALVASASPQALLTYVSALAVGDAVVLLPPDQPALLQRVIDRFDPHELAAVGPAGWAVTTRHDRPLDLHPELALLLSTSGSTGEAKFVRLSYANLIANAASIAEYLGLDRHERGLMNLPLHYSYGVSIVHSHLAVGASVLVSERSVTDEALWRFFDEQGGTSVPGVPHSIQLLEASGFFERDHPTLRTLTQAGGRLGGPLARRVADWAVARGVRFFIMYGQTEAAPRIAYVPPALARDHADCIGQAVPGGRLEVVDDAGQVIDTPGVEGELRYSGPNVMMGYATEAADLATAAGPPVLHTGDLAVREANGLFRITGRRSRFLKLFGMRVSTDEVERRLEAHGLVVACGGSDEFLGLLVVGEAPQAATAADLAAQALGLPVSAVVALATPALPQLPTGKTDHRQVQALLQAEHASRRAAADAGPAAATAAGRVRAAFEAAFPGRAVDGDDSFTALGGDSLRYVSVAVALERLVPDLPRQWEQRPLRELQALADAAEARDKALGTPERRWQRLDTAVALRAFAAVMVVMFHSGVWVFHGGAALLLALAGASFVRFQAPHLVRGEAGPVVRSFVLNVLVPFWLFAGLYGLLRGGGLPWPDLLLVGNHVALDERLGSPSGFETWFIHVLAQSLLLLVLLSWVPAVRRWLAERPFEAAVALLAIGVALRLVEPLWFPRLLDNGGRELTWQFWEFALGLVVFAAGTPRARRLATVLAVVLPVGLYLDDPPRASILAGGLLLLLWREHLSVPVAVAAVLRTLAAASLFIYMLHGRAPVHTPTADWPVDVIRIGTGLLLGIVGWAAYEWIRRQVARAVERRRTRLSPRC